MKKTLSVILSVLMLLSITAGMNLTTLADTPVTVVSVTGVKMPYSGDSPVFDLSTNSNAYYIDLTAYIDGVSWYDMTDRVGLTRNGVFKTGHDYTVTVRIKLNKGYYIDDTRVECTVDGTVAAIEPVPGETNAYDVTLRLSNCQESQVIHRVDVTDFVFPQPDQKMNTEFTVDGADAYSLYTVQDDPNFVEGKVKWFDDDTDTELTANDTFTPTHNYWFYIRLEAKDGYEFATKEAQNATGEITHDVDVYVNGSKFNAQTMAFYHISWAPCRKYLQIYGTYLCVGSIKTIKLKGYDYFFAGYTPSYYFTPEENAYIVDHRDNDGREICDGVAFYDLTDSRYILPDEKFIFGHSYTKEMAVMANNAYTLDGLSSATYNGERAAITPHFRNRDDHTDSEVVVVNLGKCFKSINTCSVTGVSDQYVYTYSGAAKKAVQAVHDGDKKLVEGTDYTVTYSNNINAGTASYIITGIGDYADTWSGTFKITRKALSNSAKIKMTYKTCVYDGKVHKQTIKVYDGTKLLKNNTDYTIAYSASNPKAVNNYSAKITFKGNYSGSKTVTYSIIPQKTSFLKTATATRNSINIKWKQQKKQTSGYEIEYSTQAAFKSGNKSVFVTSNTTTAKTISSLRRNKKYYFRIRTYKTIKKNGRSTRVYSDWSGVKQVQTRK